MTDRRSDDSVRERPRQTIDEDYQVAQRLRREARFAADHALVSELCEDESERTAEDVHFLESLACWVEEVKKPLTQGQRERASSLRLRH